MSEHDHHNHHGHGMFPLTPLKWDPALEQEDLTPDVVPAPQAALTPTSALQVRRDVKTLSEADIHLLQKVLHHVMVEKPEEYAALVEKHTGNYRMHSGDMADPGTFRFLPWHRMYLREVELVLQNKAKDLFPELETPLTLPYWRWPDPFPAWLPEQFPYPDPEHPDPEALDRVRIFDPGLKPDPHHINNLMQHWPSLYSDRLPASVSDYTRFTIALERGREPQPPMDVPFPVRSHNHVHRHIGGLMATMLSPSDPVFWLHHAEVDRLWWIWQQSHPNETPPAQYVRDLDPFPGKSYQDVHDVQTMGYTYDSDTY